MLKVMAALLFSTVLATANAYQLFSKAEELTSYNWNE